MYIFCFLRTGEPVEVALGSVVEAEAEAAVPPAAVAEASLATAAAAASVDGAMMDVSRACAAVSLTLDMVMAVCVPMDRLSFGSNRFVLVLCTVFAMVVFMVDVVRWVRWCSVFLSRMACAWIVCTCIVLVVNGTPRAFA